jgi:hypothetical protein
MSNILLAINSAAEENLKYCRRGGSTELHHRIEIRISPLEPMMGQSVA